MLRVVFGYTFSFDSKDQQLTWYLNVVEFGPRVYGLQAAANQYFKKDASRLNVRECATLITFLPRPIHFGNSYRNGHTPVAFQRRFQRIYAGLVSLPAKKEKEDVIEGGEAD